jgi:hypothetical protein
VLQHSLERSVFMPSLIRCLGAVLLAIAWAGAARAERLRLVLENGWVVPLSADGRKLDGEPRRLQLPAAAKGVFRFAPDYAFRKLYVTPTLPYQARGTAVFDLDSLKPLGFLPGVTELAIPLDDKAPLLLAKTYLTSFPDPDTFSSIEQLHYAAAEAQTLQLRSRKAWNEVVAQRENESLSFASYVLPHCYSAAHKGFLDAAGYRVIDASLNLHDFAAKSGRAAALTQGLTAGCWANGDALLAQWGGEAAARNGWPAAGALVRRSVDGQVVRLEAGASQRFVSRDSVVFSIGRDGRYAGYLNDGVTFALFDFGAERVQMLPLSGNPAFAQYSADRDAWYVPNVVYDYRGSTSLSYIEGMDGGASYGDSVYRLSVRDGVRAERLALPAELTEIGERAARLYEIDHLDDSPEDYRQSLRDKLPPLGPVGQKLQTFAIVGVIAD